MSINLVLYVLALVAFIAAAVPVVTRFNLIAVGLALVTLAQIVGSSRFL